MAHRGPDDAGRFIDAAAGLAVGHNRLSIIDLSPGGHQAAGLESQLKYQVTPVADVTLGFYDFGLHMYIQPVEKPSAYIGVARQAEQSRRNGSADRR